MVIGRKREEEENRGGALSKRMHDEHEWNTCPLHDKKCVLYCRTCQRLICNICHGEHEEHNTTSVDWFMDELEMGSLAQHNWEKLLPVLREMLDEEENNVVAKENECRQDTTEKKKLALVRSLTRVKQMEKAIKAIGKESGKELTEALLYIGGISKNSLNPLVGDVKEEILSIIHAPFMVRSCLYIAMRAKSMSVPPAH